MVLGMAGLLVKGGWYPLVERQGALSTASEALVEREGDSVADRRTLGDHA
jgi:hypothetical protein